MGKVYYYLEGSILYLQNKLWGKYYNERTGSRFLYVTTLIMITTWSFVALDYLGLHIAIVISVALIPILGLGSYFISELFKRPSNVKIKEFSQLNRFPKGVYLCYSFTLTVLIPLLLIFLIVK